MSKGIDTGDIVEEASFSLLKKDDISSVHKKCNNIFPKLTYLSILKVFKKNKLKKQSKTKIRYYKQRSFKDGKINWKNQGSNQIFNFSKSFNVAISLCIYFFQKKNFFYKKMLCYQKK